MTQPIASISLDLDNKWSYLKTHGDTGWQQFPTYLDLVIPRVLKFLHDRRLLITFFVVGQDAAIARNQGALRAITTAGHEVGNHSFAHEPWLHLYSPTDLEADIARAERHIQDATGQRPIGFRGPGFSCSDDVIRVLIRRGYQYDASTFPTFLGPLARAYYFLTARLSPEEKERRTTLFGRVRDGLRPVRPHFWQLSESRLLEIPVTTMPWLRIPIHLSYLLYLSQYSRAVGLAYFRFSLWMCRLARVAPSLLLHPLDFLGCDDEPDLSFFPAMRRPAEEKIEFVSDVLRCVCRHYKVVPMQEHASHALVTLGAKACSAEPGMGAGSPLDTHRAAGPAESGADAAGKWPSGCRP